MKSLLAVITWNRVEALKTALKSLNEHCRPYPIAVFEDAGYADGTQSFLTNGRQPEEDLDFEAVRWKVEGEKCEVYMGTANLGVAGQTNRALGWFWRRGYDHICLCNDDILAKGDFVKFYAEAHAATGINLFCFCDFTPEAYKWSVVPYRGYNVKLLSRQTGIMMSITRPVVQSIGFFDTRFPKAGEEHCEYANRARFAGHLNIEELPQHCLDVEHDLLTHQDISSSIPSNQKPSLDREAEETLRYVSQRYMFEGLFRPFTTRAVKYAGGQDGVGLRVDHLRHHATVIDRV